MKKNVFVLLVLLTASCIAFGQKWLPLISGINGEVLATVVYNNKLYVGGAFDSAGGVAANNIAVWNGSGWDSVGAGITYNGAVYSMCIYNGNLIVAGSFDSAGRAPVNNIASWNGSTWSAVGSGVGILKSDDVSSLIVYNGNLIAGGRFKNNGGLTVNNITMWNGIKWDSLGSGLFISPLEYSANSPIKTLTVYNNNLYAGGDFDSTRGSYVNHIAEWNGTLWSTLNTGINIGTEFGDYYSVCALTEYNGNLIAGGKFDSAGGIYTSDIASWNGVLWDSVCNGISGPLPVYSLLTFNNNLYVGGQFITAGSITVNGITSTDGSAWNAMDNGMAQVSLSIPTVVFSMAIYNGNLYAGGFFDSAGGVSANGIAEWSSPLGIEDNRNYTSEVIYPNPSNGIFTFEEQGINEKTGIEVYNMMGEKIYDTPLNLAQGGDLKIDLSNQPTGIYLYRVVSETGEQVASGKLVVE